MPVAVAATAAGSAGSGGGLHSSAAGASPSPARGPQQHRSPTREVHPLAATLRPELKHPVKQKTLASSASVPLLHSQSSHGGGTPAARAHSPPRVPPRKPADLPSPVLAPPELFGHFVSAHYVPPSTMPISGPCNLQWNATGIQSHHGLTSTSTSPKGKVQHISKSQRLRILGQSQSAATLPSLPSASAAAAAAAASAGPATTPASPANAAALGSTTRAASALATSSAKSTRASSGAGGGLTSPSGASRATSAGRGTTFTTSSVRPSARLRAARSQLVLSPLGGSGSRAPPVVAPASLEQGSTYISPTYTFTSGRQADGSYERWFDIQAHEAYKRTGVKLPREKPPNPPLLPRPQYHQGEETKEQEGSTGHMVEISDEQLHAAMTQQLEQEKQLQAIVDHLRAGAGANHSDRSESPDGLAAGGESSYDSSAYLAAAAARSTDPMGKRRRAPAEVDEDDERDEGDDEIDNWDDDDDDDEAEDEDPDMKALKEEAADKFDQNTYDDLTLSALRSAATDRSVNDLDAVRARARMERRKARRKKEEEARAASALSGGPGSVSFLTPSSLPGAPLIALNGLPVAGTSSSAGLGGGGGGGYTSRQMSRRVSTVGVTFHPATFDTYDEDVKQGMESVAEIYPHNQAQHSSVSHVQRLNTVEQQKREEKERLKALQVKRRARRRKAAEDQVREIFGDAWWMVEASTIPNDQVVSSKTAKALAHMRRLQAKAKRAFTSATLTIHHGQEKAYRVHPAIAVKPLNFFRILPDRPPEDKTAKSAAAAAGGAQNNTTGSTLPNGAMTSTGSGGTTYKNDGSLSALGAGPPSPLPKAGGSQMFRAVAKQVQQALLFAGPSTGSSPSKTTAPSANKTPATAAAPAVTVVGPSNAATERLPPPTSRGGGGGGDTASRVGAGGETTSRAGMSTSRPQPHPVVVTSTSSSSLLAPQTGRTPGRQGESSPSLLAPPPHQQTGRHHQLQPPQGSPGRGSPGGSNGGSSSPTPGLSDRAADRERAATLQPLTGKFVPRTPTTATANTSMTKPHTTAIGGTTVNLNKDSSSESSSSSSEASSEELTAEDGPLQSDTPPLLPMLPPTVPPAVSLVAKPNPPPPPPGPVPLSSPSWPLGPPQARREEELETLVAAATRSYALTCWLHKHGKHGLGGGGAAGVAMDPTLAHRYHEAFKTLDASSSGEITAETIALALRRTHNLYLPPEELEILLCKLKLQGDHSLAGTHAAQAARARKAFAGVSDAMLAASASASSASSSHGGGGGGGGHGHREHIQQAAFVSALATTSEWEALLDVWRARKAQAAAAATPAASSPSGSSPERRSPTNVRVASPTHAHTHTHTRRSSMASVGSSGSSATHGRGPRSHSPATLLPFLLWIPAFQRLQLIEAAMELSRGGGAAPGTLTPAQLNPGPHASPAERERASVLRAREAAIQTRFERLLRKIHMPSGSTLTELWQATRTQVRRELEDQSRGRFHLEGDGLSESDLDSDLDDDDDDSWFEDGYTLAGEGLVGSGGGGANEGEGLSDSARMLASPLGSPDGYDPLLEGTSVAATKVVDLSDSNHVHAGSHAGSTPDGAGSTPGSPNPFARTASSSGLISPMLSARGSIVGQGSRRNLLQRQGSLISNRGGGSQGNTFRGGVGADGLTARGFLSAHGGSVSVLPSSTPFGPSTINSLSPPIALLGPIAKMKARGAEADMVAAAKNARRQAEEHERKALAEHAAQRQAERERLAAAQEAAERAARAQAAAAGGAQAGEDDEVDDDDGSPIVDGVDLSAGAPVDEDQDADLASIRILRSPLGPGQVRRPLDWTAATLAPRRLRLTPLSRPTTAERKGAPVADLLLSPAQRTPKASSPTATPNSPQASPVSPAGLASPAYQVHVKSPKSSPASGTRLAPFDYPSPLASAASATSATDSSLVVPHHRKTPSNKLYRRGSGSDLDVLQAVADATSAARLAAEPSFQVQVQFTWIGAGASAITIPPSKGENAAWKRLALPPVNSAATDLIVCSFAFRSLAGGAPQATGAAAGAGAIVSPVPSSSTRSTLLSRALRSDSSSSPNGGAPGSGSPSSWNRVPSRAKHTPPLRAYAGTMGASRRTLSALAESDDAAGGGAADDAAPFDIDAPPRSSTSSPNRRAQQLNEGEHVLSFVVNPLVQLYKSVGAKDKDRDAAEDQFMRQSAQLVHEQALLKATQLGMQQPAGEAAILEAADEVVYITPTLEE